MSYPNVPAEPPEPTLRDKLDFAIWQAEHEGPGKVSEMLETRRLEILAELATGECLAEQVVELTGELAEIYRELGWSRYDEGNRQDEADRRDEINFARYGY